MRALRLEMRATRMNVSLERARMADLQMTLEPVPPEGVLLVIRNTISILKSIERNMTGKKRASILWRFNVFSVFGQTIVTFEAASKTDLTRKVAAEMREHKVSPPWSGLGGQK